MGVRNSAEGPEDGREGTDTFKDVVRTLYVYVFLDTCL